MKVSLSASHANCQAAIELLRTCDMIYTTQYESIDHFRAEFPSAIVLPLPDACPDMIEFLKARHVGDEVIGFSELFALRQHERDESSKHGGTPRKLGLADQWYDEDRGNHHP